MNQKYFLIAITTTGEDKNIPIIDDVKITGIKSIDTYTSSVKYDYIKERIEKLYKIKIKDLRVKHISNNGYIEYLGLITNNIEFREALKELIPVKKKGQRLKQNNRLFMEELHKFENVINSDIYVVKEIYGIGTDLYRHADNYKKSNMSNLELRQELINEFSLYYNFRKWMTRDIAPLKRKEKPQVEFKQMHINDYFKQPIKEKPIINEENYGDYLVPTKEDNHLSYEEKQLQEYNRRFEYAGKEKEEYLEMNDYDKNQVDDVGSWKTNSRYRKR